MGTDGEEAKDQGQLLHASDNKMRLSNRQFCAEDLPFRAVIGLQALSRTKSLPGNDLGAEVSE